MYQVLPLAGFISINIYSENSDIIRSCYESESDYLFIIHNNARLTLNIQTYIIRERYEQENFINCWSQNYVNLNMIMASRNFWKLMKSVCCVLSVQCSGLKYDVHCNWLPVTRLAWTILEQGLSTPRHHPPDSTI